MHCRKIGVFVVLVVFRWSCAFGQEGPPKLPLWEVKSPTATVYLLGSIHALRASDHPLPGYFDKVLAAADRVVFEVDLRLDLEEETQAYLFEHGLYAPPENLRAHLSGDTYRLLTNYLAETSRTYAEISWFKPWVVQGLIETELAQAAGLQEEYGVEAYLFAQAKAAGKDFGALETAAEQLQAFSSLSDEAQDAQLASLLRERAGTNDWDRLITAWKAGDLSIIAGEDLSSNHPEALQKGLYDRNKRWIPKITEYLRGTETVLVVAGAAHFATGSEHVLNLLKAEGYVITSLASAPVILSQSGAQVYVEGEEVMLSVMATGGPNLRYAWFRGPKVLEGQTNSTLELSASEASAGEYFAVVENEFGSARTAGMSLLVVSAPYLAMSRSAEGFLEVKIGGASGDFTLERSVDLKAWTEFDSGRIVQSATTILLEKPGDPAAFFRLRGIGDSSAAGASGDSTGRDGPVQAIAAVRTGTATDSDAAAISEGNAARAQSTRVHRAR